ncbi:AAA family ATPase [Myxococcota bacterium]|nr:AAA family ATPase [Myxococcota bacterium]
MSNHQIAISSLPQALTYDEATEAIYRDELDWIEEKLRLGLSVLIECDKQLTLYLYKALRARLRRSNAEPRLRCRLISGHAGGEEEESALTANTTRMQRILRELQEVVFSGDNEQIIVLPHLDVLTTTTRSGLNMETREAATLFYENPDLVFLGFKDPSFELPKVIENVFAVRHALIGIPRDQLPTIILQREARKFGTETFNPFALYKYLSGVNAVRCRQILGHLAQRLDFDPAHPEATKAIYHEIRQMTLVSDCELPNVDLQRDLGGYNAVKDKIRSEILDLLLLKDRSQNPEQIKQIEQLVPKGMIFHGPPGTGKTYFAKAIATALDATLFIVSGPELKSKWVGDSEENLRRVFSQARKSAPSIIVFDELDSFASARGTYTGSGVEHSMVNQLLTEMDGFRKEELVFVVGTTNFLESLDTALLRPGRFELQIEIPYPQDDDRKAILDIYRKNFALQISDELLQIMVQKTGGFVDQKYGIRYSGDHLYAIMRGLKREILRRGNPSDIITEEDVDRILQQKQKKPVKLTAKEQRTIAVHEAGHALCAYVLPKCPTLEKVTISTGEDQVLGYVMQAVRENKYVITRAELVDDICVLLAGRLAEQLLIGDISVGSYDDLQRASEICRMMVEELGMGGEAIGLRTVAANTEHTAELGGPRRAISEHAAARIDQEIAQLLETQRQRTEQLLADYRTELQTLVDLLLEKKTLQLHELKDIFGGRTFKSS